jgi:hypothetical protein
MNSLLFALGALVLCGSKVIKFDVTNVQLRFPYHVAFQIHVDYSKYTTKGIVIDEGPAMCMISLTCWKAIGSPTLSQSSAMVTSFYGCSFNPHGIIPTFPMHFGGNIVVVDVEVVDAPLDYKLLLGHNWTYVMTSVVSSIFHTLCFPHEGKIMVIDKLSFAHASANALVGTLIPVIDNS